MTLFDTFSSYLKLLFMGYDNSEIEKVFTKIVKNRASTLIKLDKYDTGEIKKTHDLAQHTSVRGYLRKIQKLPS